MDLFEGRGVRGERKERVLQQHKRDGAQALKTGKKEGMPLLLVHKSKRASGCRCLPEVCSSIRVLCHAPSAVGERPYATHPTSAHTTHKHTPTHKHTHATEVRADRPRRHKPRRER